MLRMPTDSSWKGRKPLMKQVACTFKLHNKVNYWERFCLKRKIQVSSNSNTFICCSTNKRETAIEVIDIYIMLNRVDRVLKKQRKNDAISDFFLPFSCKTISFCLCFCQRCVTSLMQKRNLRVEKRGGGGREREERELVHTIMHMLLL